VGTSRVAHVFALPVPSRAGEAQRQLESTRAGIDSSTSQCLRVLGASGSDVHRQRVQHGLFFARPTRWRIRLWLLEITARADLELVDLRWRHPADVRIVEECESVWRNPFGDAGSSKRAISGSRLRERATNRDSLRGSKVCNRRLRRGSSGGDPGVLSRYPPLTYRYPENLPRRNSAARSFHSSSV